MLSTAQYCSVLLSITFFSYICYWKSETTFVGIRSNPAHLISSINRPYWVVLSYTEWKSWAKSWASSVPKPQKWIWKFRRMVMRIEIEKKWKLKIENRLGVFDAALSPHTRKGKAQHEEMWKWRFKGTYKVSGQFSCQRWGREVALLLL